MPSVYFRPSLHFNPCLLWPWACNFRGKWRLLRAQSRSSSTVFFNRWALLIWVSSSQNLNNVITNLVSLHHNGEETNHSYCSWHSQEILSHIWACIYPLLPSGTCVFRSDMRWPTELDWFMPRRLQCSAEVERTRGVQTNSRTIVAAQRYVYKYAPSLWIRAALFSPHSNTPKHQRLFQFSTEVFSFYSQRLNWSEKLWDCLWGSLMCSCFQSHPPGLHRKPLCTLNCTSLRIPLFSLEDKRCTILPGDASNSSAWLTEAMIHINCTLQNDSVCPEHRRVAGFYGGLPWRANDEHIGFDLRSSRSDVIPAILLSLFSTFCAWFLLC